MEDHDRRSARMEERVSGIGGVFFKAEGNRIELREPMDARTEGRG